MSREQIVRFRCDFCQTMSDEETPVNNDVEAMKSPKGWASAMDMSKHYAYHDMCPECVKVIGKALKEASE